MWVGVCVSACDRHSLVMLFTMPSTGCCSLRLDYCRAALTLGAARTAERISHFPQQPQKRKRRPIAGRGPGAWPSGRTFLAFRSTRKKTNHNSTSTSAYFLCERRLSFVMSTSPLVLSATLSTSPSPPPPLTGFAWLRFWLLG